MKRVANRVCLIAAWAVFFGVIWQGAAFAAQPAITSLGQIKDDLIVSSRVDVDGAGAVYVVDPRRGHIVKYNQYSKRVAVFDQVVPDGRGLAVSEDGSKLYVSSADRVGVLDTESGQVAYLGGEAFSFKRIADIDIDDKGFVYVADAGDYAIKVFSPAGIMAYRFGVKGDDPGQLQGINGLTVDSAGGRVYVADSVYTTVSAPEVLVYDLDGTFVTSFPGASGFGTARLTFFNGITFDSLGRIYVFDGFKGYMYAYELSGNTLINQYTYNKVGYSQGKLSSPQDAVFDPSTGRLFVACSNGRIEILGVDGATNPVKVNVAPLAPVAVSPVAESVVPSAIPVLRFENAVDPDEADALTYDVQMFSADNLSDPVAAISAVQEGDTFTDVPVSSSGIVENNRYAWQVRAYDGTDYSAWSEMHYFWLNADDEAPTAPVVVEPTSVSTTLDGSGVLSWLAAADPDPYAQLNYEIEIASDEGFTDLHAVELVSGTEVALGTIQDYNQLLVGSGYYWRVTAIDETGLRTAAVNPGAFFYDTSVLYVQSPMPGTRVYLGGDHAYSGKFIGEAPLELRDFPVGKATVVAERAGFEVFVSAVEMGLRSSVSVDVDLVSAISPEDFKVRPVEADAQKIDLTTAAAPVIADLNGDSLPDLLVMDDSGLATLFVATPDGLLAGETLSLADPIPGAAPFVVDWNNDGVSDLLVGGTDTLSLYAGISGAPAVIQDVTTLLAGEEDFVPVVGDLNGDGRKDLLVGTASGQVFELLNQGTDGSPVFLSKRELLKSSLKGAVAPALVDWDADGQRDLLIAGQGAVYLCAADSEGLYAPVQMLSVGNLAARKAGGKGKSATTSSGLVLGDKLRVVAFDLDGKSGKDLVVGNAEGEIQVVVSYGDQPVVAYAEALQVKVEEIETAGADLTMVKESIAAGKYEQAVTRAESILAGPDLDATLAELIAELIDVLK